MNKSCLRLFLLGLTTGLLLAGCVTTQGPSPNTQNMNASGTPSPLSTSANPWNNVNPQIQAQQQVARRAQAVMR